METYLAKRAQRTLRVNTTTNITNDGNSTGNKAERLVTSGLHPRVYAILIELSLWFVVCVWSFLSAGEVGYLLFIVSGFIGVVIALPVRRPSEIANSNTTRDDSQPPSFHDWVRGDFDIEHGPLSSAEAAIIILLPIAAAAIGMMTFGIEFQIVKHSV